MLSIGDKAPKFKGLNQNGETVSLNDFKGKKLVLFFYPKDDTPKCTEVACNLRDNFSIFTKQNYTLLGVSADSDKKHQKFIEKFNFPFDLIADINHEICDLYGVWGLKKFMGREYYGIIRTTFVIDEKGVISNILTDFKNKNHAAKILE